MITLNDLYNVKVGDYIEVCERIYDTYSGRTYYNAGVPYRILKIKNNYNFINIETESEQGKHTALFNTSLPTYFYDNFVFYSKKKIRAEKLKNIF